MEQPNPTKQWRVLSVDDSGYVHDGYAVILGCDQPVDTQIDEIAQLVDLQLVDPKREYCFRLDRAMGGEEAFEMVQRSLDSADPYAVVLMDIRMPPGWDGLESATKIRAIDPQIRIVMTTAYMDYELYELRQKIGLDFQFISKPANPTELLQTVLSLASSWDQARVDAAEGGSVTAGFDQLQQPSLLSCLNALNAQSWVRLTDARDKIIYLSQPLCEAMGYRPETLIGAQGCSLESDQSGAEQYQQIRKGLQRGEVWQGELELVTAEGKTPIMARVVTIPIIGLQEEADMHLSFMYALSALDQVEQALQMVQQRVEGTAGDRVCVYAPLIQLIGNSALFTACDHFSQQPSVVRAVEAVVNRQLRSLHQVLDLHQLKSGQVQVENSPYSLTQLLDELEQIYRPQARDAGLQWGVEQQIREPYLLDGDGYHLGKILQQWIENAILFSARGRVILRVLRDSRYLLFEVEDSGRGISEQRLEQLFDRFEIDGEPSCRFKSGGLGLSVALGLAEALGAIVEVSSREGVGTTFRLKLPYQPSGILAAQELDAVHQRSLLQEQFSGRVLLLDDGLVAALLQRHMLKQMGLSVTAVQQHELLEQAQYYPFDLILVDLQCVGEELITLPRLLREVRCKVAVVALLRSPRQRVPEELHNEGYAEVLTQPVHPLVLKRVLKQYLFPQSVGLSDDQQMVRLIENTSQSKQEILTALMKMEWGQVRAAAQAGVHSDAPQYIENLITRLELIYNRYVDDGYNIVDDVESLADEIIHKLKQAADMFIAMVHLRTHFHHSIMRTVQNTIFSILTALRLQWGEERIHSLACASLTQNLSLYPLQDTMMGLRGGELSEAYRMQIRLHPKRSSKMLISMGVTDRAWIHAIAYHHERMDGSGYPHGHTAKDIPPEARLMAIADRYGSMISPRNYREAGSSKEIMRKFLVSKSKNYDMSISKALIAELGVYPPGTTVMLESGEIALVTRRGGDHLHPVVMAIWSPQGERYSQPLKRDSRQSPHIIISMKKSEDVKWLNVDRFWGGERAEQQPLFLSV